MDDKGSNITFHYLTPVHSLRNRNRVKRMVRHIFKKERKSLEHVNYIFCSDAYLLELNKTYLKHDTLTDIITFQLNTSEQPILSDIFISSDRVKENAQQLGITVSDEVLRVIIHGALHLCGFKDKTIREKKLMRAKEDEYLKVFESFT